MGNILKRYGIRSDNFDILVVGASEMFVGGLNFLFIDMIMPPLQILYFIIFVEKL